MSSLVIALFCFVFKAKDIGIGLSQRIKQRAEENIFNEIREMVEDYFSVLLASSESVLWGRYFCRNRVNCYN